MAVLTGASVVLQATNGSSNFTNAATTKLVANTVYQITSAGDRRLNPFVAVVVKVNGVTANVGTYTVNYITGTITFAADQGSGTVTVDGASVSVFTIAEITDLTWNEELQSVDHVPLSSSWVTRTLTTYSLSGSFTILKSVMVPYNATRSFDSLVSTGTPFMLEVTLVGAQAWRAWVLLDNLSNKIAADGTYEGVVSFQLAPIKGVGQNDFAVYGWV